MNDVSDDRDAIDGAPAQAEGARDPREPARDEGGPRAAYPQTPVDAERPVPLRTVPESPDDPAQWDSASTEPAEQRGTDDVRSAQRGEERERRIEAASADDGVPQPAEASVDAESSYGTEVSQGAAQPGAGDPDDLDRREDLPDPAEHGGSTDPSEERR